MQYMQKLPKVFPIGTAAKFGITEEEKKRSINHFKKVISPALEKQMS